MEIGKAKGTLLALRLSKLQFKKRKDRTEQNKIELNDRNLLEIVLVMANSQKVSKRFF